MTSENDDDSHTSIESHLKLVSDNTTDEPENASHTAQEQELARMLVHLHTCRSLLNAHEMAAKSFIRIVTRIQYAAKHIGRTQLTDKMVSQMNVAVFLWDDVQRRLQIITDCRESFVEFTDIIRAESKYVRREARALEKIEKYLSDEVKQHRVEKRRGSQQCPSD